MLMCCGPLYNDGIKARLCMMPSWATVVSHRVETMVAEFPLDIKVAVMCCVVNGPGEAKEADLGVAGGIGEGLIIKHGEVYKKVPEKELLSALRYELEHWSE